MSASDPVVLELERKISKVNQDILTEKRKKQDKEREVDTKKKEVVKAEAEVTAIQSKIDGLIQDQHQIENDVREIQTKLKHELDRAA